MSSYETALGAGSEARPVGGGARSPAELAVAMRSSLWQSPSLVVVRTGDTVFDLAVLDGIHQGAPPLGRPARIGGRRVPTGL